MTELLWMGNERVDVFVDSEENIEYHPSERPREVPDDRVEWYLSFDGWERPEEADATREEYFDAQEFIDRRWHAVSSNIRDGSVDDKLDEVEEAERNRDSGPREASVLAAIEERRTELSEE